jgi:signal transduction histidine kinase
VRISFCFNELAAGNDYVALPFTCSIGCASWRSWTHRRPRTQRVPALQLFDPSCDWVLADRDQIQRVLVNLFRNALKKAMVSSTHFASKNKAADAMIEITVFDRMCG